MIIHRWVGGIKLTLSQDHYLAITFEFPPGYRELLLSFSIQNFLELCLTSETVNLVDTEKSHNITQYIFIHQPKSGKDYFECKSIEFGLVH